MKENTEEKSLQIVDNSIFSKIRRFIIKIFSVKKEKRNVGILTMNAKNSQSHEEFVSSIKIEENSNSTRIVKLYNEYRAGKVKEEDLSNEDIEEVKNLYLKNIEKVKKSIEYYQYKIKKLNAEV